MRVNMDRSGQCILIILDGLGDHPAPGLRGRTPLEAARQVNMKRLKKIGAQGLMDPISPGVPPGSDTSHLAILGYDLEKEYFGRGPIEALGEGVVLGENEIAFRANLATVKLANNMAMVVDRRAGRISTQETKNLVDILNEEVPEVDGCSFRSYGLTEHRMALTVSGEGLSYEVTDNDPHEEGAPMLECQQRQEARNADGARRLASVMNRWEIEAMRALSKADLNEQRKHSGRPVANAVLFRGSGVAKKLPGFHEKFGFHAAAIAGGALYKGVAKAVGMDFIEVEGANGMPNTNLEGKFEAAVHALGTHDFVFLHIKATDYFSHNKNALGKSRFISKVDENLCLIPSDLLRTLSVILTGDHTTPCDRGMHSGEPVPLLLASPGIRRDDTKVFSERQAASGALGRINGTDVMKIILDATERTVELGTRPSPKNVTFIPKGLKPLIFEL